MTSIITFDPPLGAVEHIQGGSPSHSPLFQGPQSLYIDFLFTAQLSTSDYENLVVRDGARLQIWTNIPSLDDKDRNEDVWREIEFVDPEALSRERSAYRKVSLQTSSEKEQLKRPENSPFDTHTLYLAIPIPSARPHEFSFTYRVVYPSGRTTWLGFYERNGVVIIHADQDFAGPFSTRAIDYAENLSLKGDWYPYPSPPATGFTTNVDHADGLQIAKVTDMTATRIWALGKDRLLRHASILILVPSPRTETLQERLTHRLSYILSASSGATLSVSSNGGVIVSGSGTVQMKTINSLQQYNPTTVVEAALEHSDLRGNWALVASDTRSGTVTLACIGNGLPIPAVVVSFGTLRSNFTQGPTSVSVETSKFSALLSNPDATGKDVNEFAIFTSSRNAMYVFDIEEERANTGHIILEVDCFHPKFTEAHTFTVAPLYRLRTQKHLGSASRNLGRLWAAAILTSYRVVDPPELYHADVTSDPSIPTDSGTIKDARGLLTPPPSPPPPPREYSAEAQNPSFALPHLPRTPPRLSTTAEASDYIIPVNYAIRRRPVSRNAVIKHAATTLHSEPRDVGAIVHTTFQKAPVRGHSPVGRPTVTSSRRAVPKPQRSLCLMLIFRIVFKCLFASVRVFLRVVFNIRIALTWGLGLVVRGPGFTWGLLWGSGARPGRLSSFPSSNRLAKESPHHQRRLSSLDRPSPTGRAQLTPSRDDNPDDANPSINTRHGIDRSTSSLDHSRPTYREASINQDTEWPMKEPLSRGGSESSSYLNEVDGSSRIGQSDSEDTSIIRVHETAVMDSISQNSSRVGTTCSPIISCVETPRLQSRSGPRNLQDYHENNGGFYAEISPLCSNGSESVEIVVLTLASPKATDSEKDAQSAYDATKANLSDTDTALLEQAVKFLPGHQPHTGPPVPHIALKKGTHAPVNIRPVGVHSMHLPCPSSPNTPDVLTASRPSILDLSAATDTVLDQKNVTALHQETVNIQSAASGFVIRYQQPRQTLDLYTGTLVVAVGSPDSVSRQT